MTVEVRCPECRGPNLLAAMGSAGCSGCGWEPEVVIDLNEDAAPRASILIVDDEPSARRVLADVLKAGGFEAVYETTNGPDAVLVCQERHPQVVMLDYLMPAINGAQTAKLIRRISPDSRVVVFSAVLDRLPEWADACLPKTEVDRAPQLVHLITARGRVETQ